MLFPTDPNKRPDLWAKFAEKVAAGSVSFVIHGGEKLSDEDQKAPVGESVDQVVSSFRSASIVRFGSSRGYAIGPFFAFDVNDGTARLVEYAIDPEIQGASNYALQEAMQSVAINIFFERKEISEISLPLVLSGWEAKEWTASERDGGTMLRRVTF